MVSLEVPALVRDELAVGGSRDLSRQLWNMTLDMLKGSVSM